MRKIVVSEFVTLDGVMQEPGPGGEFEHGGWQLPFFDDEGVATNSRERLFTSDALLLGRVTYQLFAASWPSITDEVGFADRMNSLPKFVASTTLEEPLEWNATLIHGDVGDEVAKLKEQDGQDILVYGSGKLVDELRKRNLVDEYELWVHPVVLGSGIRLFTDGTGPVNLDLVDTKTTGMGIAILTYEAVR